MGWLAETTVMEVYGVPYFSFCGLLWVVVVVVAVVVVVVMVIKRNGSHTIYRAKLFYFFTFLPITLLPPPMPVFLAEMKLIPKPINEVLVTWGAAKWSRREGVDNVSLHFQGWPLLHVIVTGRCHLSAFTGCYSRSPICLKGRKKTLLPKAELFFSNLCDCHT